MNHLPAHSTRRLAVYDRSGASVPFIDWLAQQWQAYDAANGITVYDRSCTVAAYALHQDRFTAFLEHHHPAPVAP